MKPVRKINLLLILLFVLPLIFGACRKSEDTDTLARIYVENVIIEETYVNQPDVLTQKKTELFKKYKTNQNDFKAAIKALGRNQEEWDKFFKRAQEVLEELKKSGAVS